jgi:hypothetical protein
VVKRGGAVEPYDRRKLLRSIAGRLRETAGRSE